jgi:hypothetical protein
VLERIEALFARCLFIFEIARSRRAWARSSTTSWPQAKELLRGRTLVRGLTTGGL